MEIIIVGFSIFIMYIIIRNYREEQKYRREKDAKDAKTNDTKNKILQSGYWRSIKIYIVNNANYIESLNFRKLEDSMSEPKYVSIHIYSENCVNRLGFHELKLQPLESPIFLGFTFTLQLQ